MGGKGPAGLRLPPAERRFLKPKRIPRRLRLKGMGPEERAKAMKSLPRGTIAGPKKYRIVSAFKARISYLDGGGVEKIFLREMKGRPEVFTEYRRESYPDIETAYRKTVKEITSLGKELNREREAQRRISEAHASAFRNWAKASAEERAQTMKGLLDIVDLLQERHERSEELDVEEREDISRHRITRVEKKAAVKRLEKAIGLLEKGNIGAALTGLVGASNSLIEQGKPLRGQLAATKRDRAILEREVWRREAIANAYRGKIRRKEKMPGIKKWSPKMRLNFASGQLDVFADNFERWLSKATPKQKSNMVDWLDVLRNALSGLAEEAIFKDISTGREKFTSDALVAKEAIKRAAVALAKQAEQAGRPK
ncbi:MAG: hypothetical protein NT067_03540 [Candidatus Diapherotrites archaeon]|nr:hypothetical protein [Candidatus Diapherotrites archaeon]